MLKYLTYYKVALKENTAYKTDIIIYIVMNMVFFFVYFALWKSIYSNQGIHNIDAFTLSNTVTYYFITSLLFRFDPADAMYMNYVVWDGGFTNDLIKPWSAILADLTYILSEITMNVFMYIPFAFIIMAAAYPFVSVPSGVNLVYFFITVILGLFMNIWFMGIFHALCFHFGDQDANINLVGYLVSLPAGAFFPLAFLPAAIKPIFYALPFRFLFDTPANIYLGKLSQADIFSSWVQIILWMLLFFAIFYFIYRTGLKKYTGTGR